MGEGNERRDFFVSYTDADRGWAEWVAWQLERAGYSLVLQAWDFEPGDNFVVRMRDALDSTDRTIALISAAYLASPHSTEEWTAAFLHDSDGRNRLLQIRIEDCDPPRLLRSRVYIDLVGLSHQEARARLLAGVRRGGRRPASEPPFPKDHGATPRFPGDSLTITNLPARNSTFSGRNSSIRELHRVLTSRSMAAVVQRATVHGLGGVGKTQLALEYAYRHSTDYDTVWWVAAERPVTIPGQLADLARRLGVPELSDQAQMLSGLWDELRRRDRWLLIYDNAESLKDIEDYQPPRGEGRVVITSRSTLWGAAGTIRLDVLRREEAVLFLRRRTGATDKQALGALAEALGDLPLALEQAAAYMDETKTTPSDYLALFRDYETELLGLGAPTTTEQTIATVWQVSLDRVRANEPTSEDLLNLCAFLAPDAIPRALLSDYATVLPEALGAKVRHRLSYNTLVSIIGRYSLITLTAENLTVHRLVQSVTRANLTVEAQRRWARVGLQLVYSAFPQGSSDPATWPNCTPMLAHALATIDHAEALCVELEIAALLLNNVGVYLWGRTELLEAKELHQRALRLDEAQFGPNHLAVANSLNNLGLVLWDLVDFSATRVAHERALAIREAQLGSDHPAVAASLNNLGVSLWDLAELAEARTAHERALAILERRLSKDHPAVAASLTNLASVLGDLGELAQARAGYERALAILATSHGALTDTGDLGELAVARAVLDPPLADIEPRLVRGGHPHAKMNLSHDISKLHPALVQHEDWLRSDHPTVAKTLDNLGVILNKQGHLVDARKMFELVLDIRETRLGADHPDMGWSLTNLGIVLAELGELEEGRVKLEQGLAIREARLGADHPDVATNLSALGTVLCMLEELAVAQRTLERALGVRELHLGLDHPATRVTRENLAIARQRALS